MADHAEPTIVRAAETVRTEAPGQMTLSQQCRSMTLTWKEGSKTSSAMNMSQLESDSYQ